MEELIIREVWMVLWKLRRSRGFREMPHKVGSRKSPERVDLLQTSTGGILYPTDLILNFLISDSITSDVTSKIH